MDDNIEEELSQIEIDEYNNANFSEKDLYINKYYNEYSVNGNLNNNNSFISDTNNHIKYDKDNIYNKEYITSDEMTIFYGIIVHLSKNFNIYEELIYITLTNNIMNIIMCLRIFNLSFSLATDSNLLIYKIINYLINLIK